MKPISDIDLVECVKRLRIIALTEAIPIKQGAQLEQLADRIEELIKGIKIENRLPTPNCLTGYANVAPYRAGDKILG